MTRTDDMASAPTVDTARMSHGPLWIAARAIDAPTAIRCGIDPATDRGSTRTPRAKGTIEQATAAPCTGPSSTGEHGMPGGAWLSASGEPLHADKLHTTAVDTHPAHRPSGCLQCRWCAATATRAVHRTNANVRGGMRRRGGSREIHAGSGDWGRRGRGADG